MRRRSRPARARTRATVADSLGELAVARRAGDVRLGRQKNACASRMRSADGSARKRRSIDGCCGRAARAEKPNGAGCGAARRSAATKHRHERHTSTIAGRMTRMALGCRCQAVMPRVGRLHARMISRAALWPGRGRQRRRRDACRRRRGRGRRSACGSAPSRARPHREQLIERRLAVKDVAAGQAVDRFEIERRDDRAARRPAGRCPARSARACAAPSSPSASRIASRSGRCASVIRRELHVHRHHVLAGRRERRIGTDGNATSRYGSVEISPYFDASNARSR